jgi:ADP-ribose pyrophosphatase YjhB (NUDIX family)
VTRKTAAGLFKSIFTRKSHCPLWTFPAGRWIPGKTLPDAVLREAAENTGLRAGATG